MNTYNTCSSPQGLTCHNGAIPLWVKFGGDKGHGSFKFSLQLCNVVPNSIKNTVLVSVFKAGDNIASLHTVLDMYKEHVHELQGMKLR